MPECFTCGEEIAFDKNIRSKTGKQIPLYADMQNTHGHDEQGNPVRGPLPQIQFQPQTTQQTTYQRRPTTTTEGGATLDTKRIFQHLKELSQEMTEISRTILAIDQKVERIFAKIEYNTQIDTDKLIGQLQIVNDTITPYLRTQIKKGSDLYTEGQKQTTGSDPLSINHGDKADKFESRRNNPTSLEEQIETED